MEEAVFPADFCLAFSHPKLLGIEIIKDEMFDLQGNIFVKKGIAVVL